MTYTFRIWDPTLIFFRKKMSMLQKKISDILAHRLHRYISFLLFVQLLLILGNMFIFLEKEPPGESYFALFLCVAPFMFYI